jgi:hypothetical protein
MNDLFVASGCLRKSVTPLLTTLSPPPSPAASSACVSRRFLVKGGVIRSRVPGRRMFAVGIIQGSGIRLYATPLPEAIAT